MIFLYLTMQQRILKNAFFFYVIRESCRLSLFFKQACTTIFQFSNDYNYISFIKLPWPRDSEGTFWSSSQAATYLPQYIVTN